MARYTELLLLTAVLSVDLEVAEEEGVEEVEEGNLEVLIAADHGQLMLEEKIAVDRDFQQLQLEEKIDGDHGYLMLEEMTVLDHGCQQ